MDQVCATVIYDAEDFAKAAKYIRSRLPRRKGALATLLILPVLLIALTFTANPMKAARDLIETSALPILAVPTILGIALYVYLRRRKFSRLEKYLIRRKVDESKLIKGEHTVCFSVEGLNSSHVLHSSVTKWSGFIEVVETNEYLYLFTTRRSATLIPKRFFMDDQLRQVRILLQNNFVGKIELDT